MCWIPSCRVWQRWEDHRRSAGPSSNAGDLQIEIWCFCFLRKIVGCFEVGSGWIWLKKDHPSKMERDLPGNRERSSVMVLTVTTHWVSAFLILRLSGLFGGAGCEWHDSLTIHLKAIHQARKASAESRVLPSSKPQWSKAESRTTTLLLASNWFC